MRALRRPKCDTVHSVGILAARKLTSSLLVSIAVPMPTRVAFRNRRASSVIVPRVIWYIWNTRLHWSFIEMIYRPVRLLIRAFPSGLIWQDNKEKEQKRNENWQIKVCRMITSEQNFPNNEITEMYLNKHQQSGE